MRETSIPAPQARRKDKRKPSGGDIFLNIRAFLAALLAAACVCTYVIDVPALAALPAADKKKTDPVLKGLPITELNEDEAVQHALNRLAYGPRPGDVERIKQMGLAKWIDEQLNPKSIDDHAVETRLSVYPTLTMSSARLMTEYPNPKQAEKKAERTPLAPTREQAAQSQADAAITAMSREMDASGGTNGEGNGSDANGTMVANASNTDVPSPMKMNPATPGAGQRGALSVDPNAVPRAIADDSKRPARVVEELAMAKVTRAVYSERQLQQVMDDFWFNHFNVYAQKGEVKWYLTSYERDVIQPNTLGKFKDLLTATAKSPAMLFYLDNYLSADPRAAERQAQQRAMRQAMRRGPYGYPPRPQPQQGQKKKQERGLNENYGREVMELHTLGVDGGYTQKDVTEVARCFTGWTIEKPREIATFKFDEKLHDPDPKVVLGKKIHAGGMKDGEQVIELLVKNPNTAKFISTKLARRFVSDTPPEALVARMAKSFQKSNGDIKEVMRTMIYSPEFWSKDAYRAKIKTPYELVVSSVRALGTDVDTPMPLVQWVGRIGEPLYQCQPPTGYSDKAEAWVNTGALLSRLNFSLALAGNKVRGSRSDVNAVLGSDSGSDAKEALDRAVQVFLVEATPGTVDTLQKQLDNPQVVQAKLDDPVKQVDLGVVTGLVLGAPEFQRR
ncbi:MAG TPA: DUF1800 domain-containing protein [Candidatus Saccharimonadales bacterium]|nr:DUF1800 domain-containing protein [Candidatus Saccharimonadales bacterium]